MPTCPYCYEEFEHLGFASHRARCRERHHEENFIIDYLETHNETSVLDKEFHDAFYIKFECAREKTGIRPVRQAMKLLALLYKEGVIDRQTIKLPENHHWVYCYFLK